MRYKMTVLMLAAGFAATSLPAAEPTDLAPPFKVQVGGKPLDVGGVGYAAPFYGDFEGRGVNDLLVGQFSEGKLRIYRNEGTNAQPRFEKFTWLLDGNPEGRVPTG
jgi:hypothetical protein